MGVVPFVQECAVISILRRVKRNKKYDFFLRLSKYEEWWTLTELIKKIEFHRQALL